jgi:hypothetical protein
MHGEFKVADTVLAETKAKDYTRQQWETALGKAEQRAEPDEWPLIIVDDFYWSSFGLVSPKIKPDGRAKRFSSSAASGRESVTYPVTQLKVC